MRPRRDLAADAAQADDAERSTTQLAAEIAGFLPTPFANRAIRLWNVAQQAQNAAKEQLGDSDGIPRRRIDDRDAHLGRRIDRDIVDTRSSPPHDREPRSRA